MGCANLDYQSVSRIRTNQFVDWFKNCVRGGCYEVDSRLKTLVDGPEWTINTYKGYFVNGYKFHTEAHRRSRKTMNSGISVKASIGDDDDQKNFYGMLQEVVQIMFWGSGKRQTIFLFKCDWYDIPKGMSIHPRYHLVDINPRSRLSTTEPFIFASQAAQVYYTRYPSGGAPRRRGWWAVCTVKARHVIDISSIHDTYQDTNPPPINRMEEPNDFNENAIELAGDGIEIVEDIEVADDDSLGEEEEFDDEYEESDDGQEIPEEDDIDEM
ncbi:hypothetical protein ACS0TY_031795 [Phlomoides rotata]